MKSCGRPGLSGMKLCLMVFYYWYDDKTDCSLGKLALGAGFSTSGDLWTSEVGSWRKRPCREYRRKTEFCVSGRQIVQEPGTA
ncbi:hypothetical protein TNCV_3514161 [Trichonephila clavipes]|nr:hypothetical protein TNCV_3514161 [Trichonephila clavipes]